MSILERLKTQLITDEGIRLALYKCTGDKWSIGIGRNIQDCGISLDEAHYLFENDVEAVLEDLEINLFCGTWSQFPENIQLVLACMRFQLGAKGIREFKKMIAAVRNRDWKTMRKEMIDSNWYRTDTPTRAANMVEIVDEMIK